MRVLLSTAVCSFMAVTALGQGPLINEVVPGGGDAGDWIEVYNRSDRTIDLKGWTFVTPGRTYRLEAALPIPALGHSVLWCDRHPEKGPDHLDLKLSREGGSLLLIDSDRRTVRDMFTWRSLPAGVSLGRLSDGAPEWGYFADPTPAVSNRTGKGARRLLSAPVPAINAGKITCGSEEGSTVRYTLDGRIPQASSPELGAGFLLQGPAVITLRAFGEDALPSPPTALTLPRAGTGPFIAVRIDPDSLNDPQRGILSAASANYARNGTDWRRAAQVEWHGSDSTRQEDIRFAVSGSGTRGLPKKNFKVYGEEEMILRADATPHAFLRNLFLEAIARNGGQVDVQPSTPLPLYVNGRYEGLYRSMPAKNSAWLRTLSGAESLDLVDGPGGHALKGDDDRHTRMLAMLERGAPADSLSAEMELASLLDLACFDLYSGRADHDLNTRCWRPREKGGRWRWILFDMDLWTAPDERTVERMCSATAPEAPYLPWLLAHDELRPRLLARLSAWLATSLAVDRATRVADSLFAAHAGLMREDHERWKGTLHMPSPEEGIEALRAHIIARPAHVLEQFSERTGLALRRMTVRVLPPHAGEVAIERAPLTDDERTFSAFSGVALRFTAQPAQGYEFVGWQGADSKSTMITVDPGKVKNLRAVFRAAGSVQ